MGNAVENRLSGVCLLTKRKALVLVEGCSKSQRRFHKLLMRRIKWNLSKDNGMDLIVNKHSEKCELIWRGSIKTPYFNRFRIHRDLSDDAAKKFLGEYNAEQYWNLDLD